MEGMCTPVAAVFILPFLGRAATGGKEVRGNRHASEDGTLRIRNIRDKCVLFFY